MGADEDITRRLRLLRWRQPRRRRAEGRHVCLPGGIPGTSAAAQGAASVKPPTL